MKSTRFQPLHDYLPLDNFYYPQSSLTMKCSSNVHWIHEHFELFRTKVLYFFNSVLNAQTVGLILYLIGTS